MSFAQHSHPEGEQPGPDRESRAAYLAGARERIAATDADGFQPVLCPDCGAILDVKLSQRSGEYFILHPRFPASCANVGAAWHRLGADREQAIERWKLSNPEPKEVKQCASKPLLPTTPLTVNAGSAEGASNAAESSDPTSAAEHPVSGHGFCVVGNVVRLQHKFGVTGSTCLVCGYQNVMRNNPDDHVYEKHRPR